MNKRGWFSKLWMCYILGLHDWTTDLEQRGTPLDLTGMTNAQILQQWKNDTRMYCQHCLTESVVSKRHSDAFDQGDE